MTKYFPKGVRPRPQINHNDNSYISALCSLNSTIIRGGSGGVVVFVVLLAIVVLVATVVAVAVILAVIVVLFLMVAVV